MKELFVRALSGGVYICLVILSLFISREWFMGLFLVLGLISLWEFSKLVKLTSYLSYFLLAGFLFFLSYKVFDDNAILLFLILNIFVSLFLLSDLLQKDKIPMFLNKKYISVIFYLIGGFVFLTLIPFHEGEFMPNVIIGVFVLIWSNDTFAYIVGKNFGKRKLLERISPKKTIEGLLGGIIGSLIAGYFVSYYTDTYSLKTWLIIRLIASVFGTVGDLIQSKFKRQANVKDSGVLMPGHGGLYDRLDSIIYASPFIYAFLEITAYVS